MINKKEIHIYDILKIHVLCCLTIITLSILIQTGYIISGIVVLSKVNNLDQLIYVYVISSLCLSFINIISYLIFYTYHNINFLISNIIILALNISAVVWGLVTVINYNSINEISIIAIVGILVHIIESSIFIAAFCDTAKNWII